MLISIVPVCVPGIQFFERCAENSEDAQWLTPLSVIPDSCAAVGFLHMLYFFFDASARSVLHDYKHGMHVRTIFWLMKLGHTKNLN